MPSDGFSTIARGLGAARPRSDMTRRVEVLCALLERYNDLVDPMQTGKGDGQTGLMLMPATYTPTVRELERLVRWLREGGHEGRNEILRHPDGSRQRCEDGIVITPKRLWRHLNWWYIDAKTVPVRPPKQTRKNRRGRKELVKQPVDDYGEPLAIYLDKDGRTRPLVRVLRNAEARYPIALKAVETLAENWGLTVEPMLPDELRDAA